ncbi:hypothetical protein F5Y18DRAFT_245974 [Xylariaceae sp. FL1019]|nr:hypothetical protein F5Y18DRAFT_245974 [Xylariaceae sp. FL1019]
MPKNYGRGGKTFRKAKASQANRDNVELLLKEGEEQLYALVGKALGNGRYHVRTISSGVYGKLRIGVRRGALRKRRVYVNTGDVVLVALRDFNEDDVCDIIHRYSPSNARQLQKLGELPEDALVDQAVNTGPQDQGVVFQDDDEEDDDEVQVEKSKRNVRLPASEYYPADDEQDEESKLDEESEIKMGKGKRGKVCVDSI